MRLDDQFGVGCAAPAVGMCFVALTLEKEWKKWLLPAKLQWESGERHQFYNNESYNKNNKNQYWWLQIATILQKWPPINTGTLCTFPLRVWENVENWLICIITVPFACFFEGVRLIFTAALSLSLKQWSRKNSSPVFLFTNILFNFAKIDGNKVCATSNTNVNGFVGQIASLNL